MALRAPALSPRSASVSWDTVPGKPATFPPAAHNHPISEITGLQNALDGKQAAGSCLPTASFTWANLSGKPTTFAPSAHTHPWSDITGKPTVLQFVGNVTVAETIAVALVAGDKRKVLALAGVTTSDKLIYVALAPCTAGCEALNIYATGANQVTVSYSTPTLAVGATVNIPIAVYRIV